MHCRKGGSIESLGDEQDTGHHDTGRATCALTADTKVTCPRSSRWPSLARWLIAGTATASSVLA